MYSHALKMYTSEERLGSKEINVYLDHDKVHKEDSEDLIIKTQGQQIYTKPRNQGDLDDEMKESFEIAKCPYIGH